MRFFIAILHKLSDSVPYTPYLKPAYACSIVSGPFSCNTLKVNALNGDLTSSQAAEGSRVPWVLDFLKVGFMGVSYLSRDTDRRLVDCGSETAPGRNQAIAVGALQDR